jgi:hypothetical protein
MRLSPYYIPVILGLTLVVPSSDASAQVAVGVGITVPIAPPLLPVYVQPPIPAPGYIWTPGYWAYDDDYYWVPGTWVMPPTVGVLWTPPYWGFVGGVYTFNAGFWGAHVGFYGGINYGFGYVGVGFEGGYWEGGNFFYNRSVTNIGNTHITNVYNKTVINNNNSRRVAFNGPGGVEAKPTPQEEAAMHEKHVPPPPEQTRHLEAAKANPALRAKVNHGKPAVAATAKPGEFKGPGVVAAKAAGRKALAHANAGRNPAANEKSRSAKAQGTAPGTKSAHAAAPHHAATPHEKRPHEAAAPHEPHAAGEHASTAHRPAPPRVAHAATPHVPAPQRPAVVPAPRVAPVPPPVEKHS